MPVKDLLANASFSIAQMHSITQMDSSPVLPISVTYSQLPGGSRSYNNDDSSDSEDESISDFCYVTAASVWLFECDIDGKFPAEPTPKPPPAPVQRVSLDLDPRDFRGKSSNMHPGTRHGSKIINLRIQGPNDTDSKKPILKDSTLYKMYIDFTLDCSGSTIISQSPEIYIMGSSGPGGDPQIVEDEMPIVKFTTDGTSLNYVEFTADWGNVLLINKFISIINNSRNSVKGVDYPVIDYDAVNSANRPNYLDLVDNGLQKLVLIPWDGKGVKPANPRADDKCIIPIYCKLNPNEEYTIILKTISKGLSTAYSSGSTGFFFSSGIPDAPTIKHVDNANGMIYFTLGKNAEDLEYYKSDQFPLGLPLKNIYVEANNVSYETETGMLLKDGVPAKGDLSVSILNNLVVDDTFIHYGAGYAFDKVLQMVVSGKDECDIDNSDGKLISLYHVYSIPIAKVGVDLSKILKDFTNVSLTLQQGHGQDSNGRNLRYSTTSPAVTSVNLSVLPNITSVRAEQDWTETTGSDGTDMKVLNNNVRVTITGTTGSSTATTPSIWVAKKLDIDNIISGKPAEYDEDRKVVKDRVKAREARLSDYTKLSAGDVSYAQNPIYNTAGSTTWTGIVNGDKMKELGYFNGEVPVMFAAKVEDQTGQARPYSHVNHTAEKMINRTATFKNSDLAPELSVSQSPDTAEVVLKLSKGYGNYGSGLEASTKYKKDLKTLREQQEVMTRASSDLLRLRLSETTRTQATTNTLNAVAASIRLVLKKMVEVDAAYKTSGLPVGAKQYILGEILPNGVDKSSYPLTTKTTLAISNSNLIESVKKYLTGGELTLDEISSAKNAANLSQQQIDNIKGSVTKITNILSRLLEIVQSKVEKSMAVEKTMNVRGEVKIYHASTAPAFEDAEYYGDTPDYPVFAMNVDNMDSLTKPNGFLTGIILAKPGKYRVAIQLISNTVDGKQPADGIFMSVPYVSSWVNGNTSVGPVQNFNVKQTRDGTVAFEFDKLPKYGTTYEVCIGTNTTVPTTKLFTVDDAASNFNFNVNGTPKIRVILKSVTSGVLGGAYTFNIAANQLTYTWTGLNLFSYGDYLHIMVLPKEKNLANDDYSSIATIQTVIPSAKLTVSTTARSLAKDVDPIDPAGYDDIITHTVTGNGQDISKMLMLVATGSDMLENECQPVVEFDFNGANTPKFTGVEDFTTIEKYTIPELGTVDNLGNSVVQSAKSPINTIIYESPLQVGDNNPLVKSVYYNAAGSNSLGAISNISIITVRFNTHNAKVAEANTMADEQNIRTVDRPAFIKNILDNSTAGVVGIYTVVMGVQDTSKPASSYGKWQ